MNIKAKLTPKPCRLGGAITLSNIVKIIKMPHDQIRIDYLDERGFVKSKIFGDSKYTIVLYTEE